MQQISDLLPEVIISEDHLLTYVGEHLRLMAFVPALKRGLHYHVLIGLRIYALPSFSVEPFKVFFLEGNLSDQELILACAGRYLR